MWHFLIAFFYLVTCIYVSSMSFHDSLFFFLMLNNIPSFGDDEYSCYKHPWLGFCVDVSFHLFWLNTKEHDSWIT